MKALNSFFPTWISNFNIICWKDDVFSIISLCSVVTDQLTIWVGWLLGSLYYFINLVVYFFCHYHSLDCYRHIKANLKFRYYQSSNFVLVFEYCFAYSRSFALQINFSTSFWYIEITSYAVNRECVESMDQDGTDILTILSLPIWTRNSYLLI